MATRKQYDWVGENLSNPDFTNTDFKNAGINITNTSIGPESIYVNNPQIRLDPEFLTNGKFDESKFHEKYIKLATSYNNLAKDTYNLDIKYLGRIFAENNVFVSPEERRLSSTAYMTLIDNPDHITYGISGLDKAGPRTKTPMELAEMHPIFDPKTGKFTEYTLEESFFKDFWRPKIMATYDTDVDINGNPTNDPAKVAHYRGEYKLKDGEYYSEFADGKSTYGKEVVSLWNIITKENSWINQYDPFDSDDIKKSTAGSIARNALKILPLLPIPIFTPIAPYYAAASIGINLVDALGTLGKLVVGSENKTLNKITAFAEQFNLTTSEEGLTSTFSMENVINMIGDTFMFLKSQRILAEQAPRLFMNRVYEIKNNPEKEIEALAASYMKDAEPAIKAKYGSLEVLSDPAKLTREAAAEILTLRNAAASKAVGAVNAQIENFNKLGRQISTSMMAITFGLHTYGTAKAQDVTDEVATALTLGAIAGQYGLLSSHIGQKIFPEATILRQQLKKAIQEWADSMKLKGSAEEYASSLTSKTTAALKAHGVKAIMQDGKKIADKVWGVNGSLYGTVGANTVATSIEMTSFTMLDDVIASIYNLGAWLSGEDNRMSAWDNIANRYGSSLLGGAIAGAISAPEIYDAKKKIDNMPTHLAYELLAYMINERKTADIIKEIDRNPWSDPYLSPRKIAESVLSDGEVKDIFGTAAPNESQNDEAKLVMKQAIYDMEKILTTYGTKIDSDSLLNVLINGNEALKDIRFAKLKDSNIAQMYIKEYVLNLVDIYTLAKKYRAELTDALKREVNQEETKLEKLPQKLLDEAAKTKDTAEDLNTKELLKKALLKNADYFNGKMSNNFIEEALFEMQPGINMPFYDAAFIQYADKRAKEAGKESFELLDLPTKRKYALEFYNTNTGQLGVDNLRLALKMFKLTDTLSSPSLKKLSEVELPEKVKNIKAKVEDLKSFIRNELYFKRVNPYDSPVASPYVFNSKERPEDHIRTDFINKAETKLYEDALHMLTSLLDSYREEGKINEETKRAIETVRSLFTNWGRYVSFIKNTEDVIKEAEAKHKEWEAEREAAQIKGEQFDKEEPEVYEFNSKFIKEELENSYHLKQTLGQDENSFEKVFLDIIEKAEKAILSETLRIKRQYDKEVPAQELVRINNLKGLLQTFLNPEAFKAINYQTIGGEIYSFSDSIQRMLEGLLLHTVGRVFSEDIMDSLSGKGYIDLETRNLLTTFIDRLNKGLWNRVGSQDLLILEGAKNVVPKTKILLRYNPLEALELIDDNFKQVRTTMLKLATSKRERDLGYYFRGALKRLQNFSSDGIVEAADKLMKDLKFSGHTVSEILLMLETTIVNQTDKTSNLLLATRTNIKEFILSPTALQEMDNAILILLMIRSDVVATNNVVSDSENAIGFNPTYNKIHGLTGKEALAVLESNLVNDTVLDISDIIYKLLYWKQVAANAMRLRTELTDLADLGLKINLYDLILNKVQALKSLGWKDVEKFESAAGGLLNLALLREQERNARIAKLPDEIKDAVEKEFISFQQALHDFLKTNDDIISKPEELSKFVLLDHFKIDKASFKSITKEDVLDDDVALLHFIAAVGAIDPKAFYSNLSKALGGNKLPVAIQNIWKYLAIAFSFNKEYIHRFNKALEYSYKQKFPDLNSTDPEKKKEAQKNFVKAFLGRRINPYRSQLMLIESGPGSGKTDGYLPELINLIHQMDVNFDVTKDIWIAAPEDLVALKLGENITKPAEKIRDAIKSKTEYVFTRETLLRKILKDYDKYEAEFPIKNGTVVPVDSDGNPKIIDVDINTGRLIFDHELNDSIAELPKLLILDEISDYSSFDLDIILDFAAKHNITVLTSGDFTQSGVYGEIQSRLGDEVLPNLVRPTAGEFGTRSFKSLMSFRTTNTQSDNNNNVIRPYFEGFIGYARSKGTLQNLLPKDGLVLGHYFDSSTGDLFGTYIAPAEETLSDDLKMYIDGIYLSIKDNPEKNVTFLYSDTNSPVYKYITSSTTRTYDWNKKTDFRQDTVLKGVENTYYIIDLDPKIKTVSLMTASEEEKMLTWMEAERVAREYYTALTRQKLGAIVIDRFSHKLPNFNMSSKSSDEDTSEISMSLEFIQKRNLKFSELLKSIFPEVTPLNMTLQSPTGAGLAELPPLSDDDSGSSEHGEFGLGNNYKVESGEEFNYEDALDDKGYSKLLLAEDGAVKETSHFSNDGSTFEYISPTAKQGDPMKTTIPNDQIRGIIHTFNAAYTGYNSDGKLVPSNPSTNRFGRRDAAYGLRHLMDLGYIPDVFRLKNIDLAELTNPQNNETIKVVLDLLDEALSICTTHENVDALRELSNLLGLNGVQHKVVRWVFTSKIKDQAKYPPSSFVGDKFALDFESEKGFNAVGYGEKNNEIPRKVLSLVIGIDNGTNRDILISLPVATLPHWATVLETNSQLMSSIIGTKYKQIAAKYPNTEDSPKVDYEMLQYLKQYLVNTTNPIVGAAGLLKLLEVWRATNYYASYMSPGFELVKTESNQNGNFIDMGPFMLTARRGLNYRVPGYEQNLTDPFREDKYKLHNLETLEQRYDVSSIFVPRNESDIKYVSNNGYTIKKGAYHVLVARKGVFRVDGKLDEDAMFRALNKLLENPKETNARVKILQIRPPKATVKEFLDSEYELLFNNLDPSNRPRQDVGNHFTVYRILLKLFENYDETLNTPFNRTITSVVNFLGGKANVKNVREDVLRLTYLEGQIDPSRKGELGEIYVKAENELDDEVKRNVRESIKPNQDYVLALSIALRETSKSSRDWTVRNQMRYFLQYLANHKELELNTVEGEVPEIKQFLEDELSKYVILHNVAFNKPKDGETVHTVLIKYPNSDQSEQFLFYRANTDKESKTFGEGKFRYHGKPFEFAAQIINGPLYGDVTSIVDSILKSFKTVNYSTSGHPMPASKHTTYYRDNDIKGITKVDYFNDSARNAQPLLEGGGDVPGALQYSDYSAIYYGPKSDRLFVIVEKATIKSALSGLDFNNPKKVHLDLYNTYKENLNGDYSTLNDDENTIFTVDTSQGVKYLLLNKPGGRYAIKDITKPSEAPPPIGETTQETSFNIDQISRTDASKSEKALYSIIKDLSIAQSEITAKTYLEIMQAEDEADPISRIKDDLLLANREENTSYTIEDLPAKFIEELNNLLDPSLRYRREDLSACPT